jgi:D-alanine-D-alanine ligase
MADTWAAGESVPAAGRPRPRVAVVFGGRSSEHAISCVSAGSVLRAIDRDVYDVVPVGITTDGRWVLAPDDPDALTIESGKLPAVDTTGAQVVLAGDPTAGGLQVYDAGSVPRVLGDVDVVLPLLHGPFGEDGTLQGLLELAGVPYVGSGVLSSAAAMDKSVMKVLLAAAGLPVGPYVVVPDRDWPSVETVARIRSALSLPVFVKPARAGSSVGVSRVASWDDLADAVEEARAHDPKVLVEQAVPGREVECGVLETEDGRGLESSVCGEITVLGGHDFYDFEAKYIEVDDVTRLDVPADLPVEVADRVRAMAQVAFRALECEGFARVDFFVGADGSVTVNELNTIPGFTPVSMFPLMWAATGVPYPELVDRLLSSALRKRRGLR